MRSLFALFSPGAESLLGTIVFNSSTLILGPVDRMIESGIYYNLLTSKYDIGQIFNLDSYIIYLFIEYRVEIQPPREGTAMYSQL